VAVLSVSFQQEIPHGKFKGTEEKKSGYVKQISPFQIINVADFRAFKFNAYKGSFS
jgi:hypothetical protein